MRTIVAHFIMADDAYDSNQVNPNKDYTWQKKMTDKYKGKPEKPGDVLPEGTFTKSPSEIAVILKNHAPDYKSAMSHLNSFINRSGRNLEGADKERLHQAKDTVRNAYGKPDPKEKNQTPKTPKTPTTSHVTKAIAEQPIYSLPLGHNKDDGMVDLFKVEPDNREKNIEQDPQFMASTIPKLNAAYRLKASILNTEQDPSTRMSSVEKNATSTLTENLDETNVAPKESVADATFDSLDGTFEETKTPTNTAYARARVFLSQALKALPSGK